MLEKFDMDKLQKVVYFINNVKMTSLQRERLNGLIVVGILRGEIETEDFICIAPETESSIMKFLISEDLFSDIGSALMWVKEEAFMIAILAGAKLKG